MTRKEFDAGWQLMIIQPWGRGHEYQMRTYYRALSTLPALVWWSVALKYAWGNRWPSLYDIQDGADTLINRMLYGFPPDPDTFRKDAWPTHGKA